MPTVVVELDSNNANCIQLLDVAITELAASGLPYVLGLTQTITLDFVL